MSSNSPLTGMTISSATMRSPCSPCAFSSSGVGLAAAGVGAGVRPAIISCI
ncbi:hypothetical protein [Paenibacillus amylolyticus]|uniref:hypothetical protein n=1 Tax=uncultured Paenibacillus sp. TaxID=227322 RepID=UPI00338F35C0